MLGRLAGILALLVVTFTLISPAAAQKVALVIGNTSYKNAIALPNAVNDAGDLGSALSRIGFNVTTLTDASADTMRRAVVEFGDKAKGADIALIFFAGHAVEADGAHWSIPVDSKVESLDDIKAQSVNLEQLLGSAAGSKLTILLVDTARDNPFAEDGKPAPNAQSGNQSKGQPKGQAKADAQPEYSLLVFSTSLGGRPLDGEGQNSPFAAALLKHIEAPGIDLNRLARNVRDDVAIATKGQQIPAYYAVLPSADILLVPR